MSTLDNVCAPWLLGALSITLGATGLAIWKPIHSTPALVAAAVAMGVFFSIARNFAGVQRRYTDLDPARCPVDGSIRLLRDTSKNMPKQIEDFNKGLPKAIFNGVVWGIGICAICVVAKRLGLGNYID